MAEKVIGLSRDLIIHPGEFLKEELEERDMTQEELAHRCGCSPKNISSIISGRTDISVSFAKKLEYVLGIDSSYWNNLQCNYDQEIHEYEEISKIESDEMNIIKEPKFRKVIKFLKDNSLISKTTSIGETIIELRKLLEISNLRNMSSYMTSSAFRVSSATSIDQNIMFVWIRLCRVLTEDIEPQGALDKKKLKQSLNELKQCMFIDAEEMQSSVTAILSKCGIAFNILPHFTGAPVQGCIQQVDEKIILGMTIRGAYADIFWFTLFHEIAHILYGDYKNRYFLDYIKGTGDIETRANTFAANFLINPEDYEGFTQAGDLSEAAVIRFALEQKVQPYIVVGRIQRDRQDYRYLSHLKQRYCWAEK